MRRKGRQSRGHKRGGAGQPQDAGSSEEEARGGTPVDVHTWGRAARAEHYGGPRSDKKDGGDDDGDDGGGDDGGQK